MLNTTNTTAKKQTAWVINLFVQPDPFAATVDNAATVTSLSSATSLAAVNKVTSVKYGAATAKAATISEAAIKFVKNPSATGGTLQITIAGSTDVAGYVYCAVAKTASRRMLNATNTTAAKPAPVATSTEITNLRQAGVSAKYNVQRQEMKTGALTFSFTFKSLAEGKNYGWMCEATSLNPNLPKFKTPL